jgi:hypothetical protein
VADAHGGILRVIDPKSVGDLLGAPRDRPSTALAMNGATLFPYHGRTGETGTLCVCDLAGKALFDVGPQCGIGRQLAGPRSQPRAVGMPLSRTRPVVQIATTRCSVTPHLPRDCARRTSELAPDRADPSSLSEFDSDLFPLAKGQKSSGQWRRRWRQMCWRHSSRTPKPARAKRRRYTGIACCVLACKSFANGPPETAVVLTLPGRRTPG